MKLRKNISLHSWFAATGAIVTAVASTVVAAPLGTGFNYQGKLADNGQPATGIYDFVFSLYTSTTNPVPVYSGVLVDDVAVTNGVFTTEIDFGADLFTGQEMWMEVGVRPGNETGDVTLLEPRQHITATPYAHFAKRAAVADTAANVTNVNWSAVKNLPPSLADGIDNDTIYSAGVGLSLNVDHQFSINYGGNGSVNAAARSDHNHLGQEWIGSTNNNSTFRIQNTSASGIGFWGKNDQYGSGFQPWNGAGVFGDSSTDPGVAGYSNTGPGVYGWISALVGAYDAIKGENASTTGRAVAGYATATNGANIGVLGQTDSSSGTGIRGYATSTKGTNYGGRFTNKSPAGNAIHGLSDYSGVAMFDIQNRNNASIALESRTVGTGGAAKFTSTSYTNTASTVAVTHYGNGDAIEASARGAGSAGNFEAFGNFPNNAAVLATGLGSARGLKAFSTTGEAIRAESTTGTAIIAKTETDGTALAIDGGAIQIKGAGIGTHTAVFVHKCTDANVVDFPAGNPVTIIDHPMCNNNPNAILFVTPRIPESEFSLAATYDDVAIMYSSNRGRWQIINASGLDEVGDFDVGDLFNVMVFVP